MQLSLSNLKDLGAFAGALVRKEIAWPEGSTCTVYVRPMSYHTAVSSMLAAHAGGDQLAARIAACICDEHGKPIFSAADVTGEADPERGPLCERLTVLLLNAIAEVSDEGKPQATSSPKKKTSGTNSSKPASEAERSQKPSIE